MSRFRSPAGGAPMRGRIDTRPQSDPAVAMGNRNLHRGSDGTAIGGINVDGQAWGTMTNADRRVAGSITPRLDAGPNTPRLDAIPRGKSPQDAARASALSGAFGTRAKAKQENLDGRQSLFRDMKTVGAGGVSPEMKSRAASLGVDEKGFGNAMAKLQGAPASIAAPGAPAVGNPNQIPSSIARRPGMPAAPLAGNAKAYQDMATIGLDQAAKNFMADNKATLDSASGKPPARIARAAEGNVIPQSIAKPMAGNSVAPSSPKDKKWTTVYNPMEAKPRPISGGVSTPIVKEDKPAWGQGITAPMTTPAPLGLGQSLAADAQSVGKVAKKAGSMFRDGVVNKAANMVKSQNDAVVTMGERQKGAVNAVANTITGASNLSQKLIPGQTGDAIRSMELPKKAGNAIRSAGNAMSDMSMKPMKAASRFRNAAFGQFKRAVGG